MLVHQAFRFELDPNRAARSAMASHAGAARFAYNWGLVLVVERIRSRRVLLALAQRQGASPAEAEAWAVGVAGELPWSLPALRREWNRAKAEVAPWWAENSKEAYNSGLDALARALDAWSRSRRAGAKGRRWASPDSASGAPGAASASPRGRSASSTSVTFGFLASGSSAPRSQPAP